MAVTKTLESLSLTIEIQKGVDKAGDPTYTNKTFANVKSDASLDNVYAVADDLITKQIVINVKQAGTLSTHIGNSKKNKITDLKLTGELKGTDFLFIREMAGAPSIAIEPIGNAGNLKNLDLSDAKIVSGGSSYFSYDQYNYCHTKDDVIGKSMFYGCAGIEDLIIPTNVTSTTTATGKSNEPQLTWE